MGQTRPTLEIHVDAHVRATQASRPTTDHGNREVEIRHEVDDARNRRHEDDRDGNRPEQVYIDTFVDDLAEILHSIDSHVLDQELATEVGRREQAERCAKDGIEEHKGWHRIPEQLSDFPARRVVRLLDVAPRWEVPRRIWCINVRNLLRDHRHGCVPQGQHHQDQRREARDDKYAHHHRAEPAEAAAIDDDLLVGREGDVHQRVG
mmetsp:Transcript_115920/g.368606  ORF Transcript_115920/g.368606 Transcript_115920/m.368606 type:complete len:206 (+) Transcript_115920:2261-2878(+)